TLQQRLKRGAIPVAEALRIAKQIAEALEAPHERGVIRRDLKPGNIKLTSDGNGDIGDVRIHIEHALKEPEEIALSHVHTRGLRFAWVLLAVLGALVAVLSIPTTLYLRERSSESPEMRLDINTPRTPQPLHFALSPDGRRLIFVSSSNGSQQLWLRPLNAATAQPLAGTEEGEYPFWSPDSRSIDWSLLEAAIVIYMPLTSQPAVKCRVWQR